MEDLEKRFGMSFGSDNPEAWNNITHKAAAKFLFMNYQYVYGDGPPMDDPLFHDSAPFNTMTAIMDSLQQTSPASFDTIMRAGGHKYTDEFHADYQASLIDSAMNLNPTL